MFRLLFVVGLTCALFITAKAEPPLLNHTLTQDTETLSMSIGVTARTFYSNDQRIQWSGGECTFGTEAALTPEFIYQTGASCIKLSGEFFLQQPYEKNVYYPAGDAERASYRANYDIPAFDVSQLYFSWQFQTLEITAGKMLTPFGRIYFPLMSNSKFDAPFIRSESIDWRQTGVVARWTPSLFDVSAGLVNGCENLDTNSMKALVARAGMDFNSTSFGVSVLVQDGVGSEETKEYRNHYGFDAAYCFGNWTLSAEGIYDEYGNRRGQVGLDEIYWEHSLYYRQINNGWHTPIHGFGGYIDATWFNGKYLLDFNYGEFHPEQLRNPDYPQHDIINRRCLVKGAYYFNKYFSVYTAALVETAGFKAQSGKERRGTCILAGLQAAF